VVLEVHAFPELSEGHQNELIALKRILRRLTVGRDLIAVGICHYTRVIWPCRTVLQVERSSILLSDLRCAKHSHPIDKASRSLTVSVHASIFTLLIRNKSVAWNGLMIDIFALDTGR
jgi:hypothetical protein